MLDVGTVASAISAKRDQMQAWRRRSFAFNLAAIGAICPLCFFLMLLPLSAKDLHMELFDLYLWGWTYFSALFFSEMLGRLALGNTMPRHWLALVWIASMLGACAAFWLRDYCGFPSTISKIAGMFTALLGPVVYRIIVGVWNQLPLSALAWYMLGMNFGSTPIVVVMGLYAYMLLSGSVTQAGPLLLGLLLWSVAAVLVKPIGALIFTRASPAAKFSGPRVWLMYCDFMFGNLGLLVFGGEAAASVAYALTVFPMFGINAVRGLSSVLQRTSSQEINISRLEILLESLSAILGRLAAYTLFFLMRIKAALGGSRGFWAESPSYVLGRSMRRISLDIFVRGRPADGEWAVIVANLFGAVALCAGFWAYCRLLPRIWKGRKAHHRLMQISPMPDGEKDVQPMALGRRPMDEDDFSRDVEETETASTTRLAVDLAAKAMKVIGRSPVSKASERKTAWEPDAEQQSSEGDASPLPERDGSGWVMGGTRSETRQQQYLILNRFLNQHTVLSFSLVFFTFMCTLSVANLQGWVEGTTSGEAKKWCQ